jgi:hypothetical protein
MEMQVFLRQSRVHKLGLIEHEIYEAAIHSNELTGTGNVGNLGLYSASLTVHH